MVSIQSIERICTLLGLQPGDILSCEGKSREWLNDQSFFDWYQTTSVEEKRLIEKVGRFEEMYFSDMSFQPHSVTDDFISAQDTDGNIWYDSVPEEMEYFTTTFYRFHIGDLDEDVSGCFNYVSLTMTISPEHADDDSVILHEMIHMHESLIEKQPRYFHDIRLWSLYKDLKEKINDLDERIAGHGNVFNEENICSIGGAHDIMFLLKSYDLDLRQGYPLGTVFGYGYSKEK